MVRDIGLREKKYSLDISGVGVMVRDTSLRGKKYSGDISGVGVNCQGYKSQRKEI